MSSKYGLTSYYKEKKHFFQGQPVEYIFLNSDFTVPLKYLNTWLMGFCTCLLNNHKGLLDLCLVSLLGLYSWGLFSLPPFFYL